MAVKGKLLCILHYSPPMHGASKMGDYIRTSKKLNKEFECRFIKIKSSRTIDEIGSVNFRKFIYFAEMFFKILFFLIAFRPEKIYYTVSIRGVAFYRDLVISFLLKSYSFFSKADIYYHYHTKGVSDFVDKSKFNLKLTSFFLKNINLILLSPLLESDFNKVKTYKNVLFLPNGVELSLDDKEFISYIRNKFKDRNRVINILFLSNMIKEKGFFDVLRLAKENKCNNMVFHFAGSWKSEDDEKEFYEYVASNSMQDVVRFHGFVNGSKKKLLFRNADILIFPTKNDAFPLVVVEALSYGVPVLSTNEGAIKNIISSRTGIVIDDLKDLSSAFTVIISDYLTLDVSFACRKRYLENYTVEKFEENLVEIFKS